MLIDPTNPEILYNGGNPPNGIIYVGKTTNGGLNWTYTQLGTVAGGRMLSMAMDPSNSAIVYCGGYELGVQALYKTTNAGANWSKLPATGISGYYYSLAVDPANSDIVYTGTANGVYKSTNGGNSFSSTAFPGGKTWAVLVVNDPLTDAIVIYAGTDGNGVYTSNNGGSTWTQMSNTGLDERYVRHLSFNPVDRYLYAGTTCNSIYREQIPPIPVQETKPEQAQNGSVTVIPNPSKDKTRFCFTLARKQPVELTIFDIQGRMVKSFRTNELGPGAGQISWDGRDNDHQAVAAGVYFYTMKTTGQQRLGKLTITR